MLARARKGEVVILTTESDDRVRALVRLDNMIDGFLYVGRFIDPEVIAHTQNTTQAVEAYQSLEGSRSGLQLTFALVFLIVALLLLLVSAWVALVVAGRLAKPITTLIDAAERVRAGDLSVRVDPGAPGDELATLRRAFNRMTSQLDTQRRDLIEANRQLDTRRRFSEAVLTGVSASVLGLDKDGYIRFPNKVAGEFLGLSVARMLGEKLERVLPEMTEIIEQARSAPEKRIEQQLAISRQGWQRTIMLRVTTEYTKTEVEDGSATYEIKGFVVTFDDITQLIQAQRTAAWAEVARRMAHEIKNPLTPIQLSAERLKRKYLAEIKSDPDTFAQCTDTIVRHVGDLGQMVDEFSNFARMPTPVFRQHNIKPVLLEVVQLFKQAHPSVAFKLDITAEDPTIRCDSGQLRQVIVNLVKNAVESIQGRTAPKGESMPPGWVKLAVYDQGSNELCIDISDNGKGWPQDQRDRLTEPYVTTREKGTGLGLAIVKKIIEDHKARLLLKERGLQADKAVENFSKGAIVCLKFIKLLETQDAA